jgi:ring-1,2-phenylacetyl-CoA epoxidase subunit PaaE
MAKFKLFSKKSKSGAPRGFHDVTISEINRLTDLSVKVVLDIPSELSSDFSFEPGQYLDFEIEIDGSKERRSYSICSGPGEKLAIGVKAIVDGKVSNFFNKIAKSGDSIYCSTPNGSFIWKEEQKTVVAFAAGSGITPILSIAKHAAKTGSDLTLFYGNQRNSSAMFLKEVTDLLGDKATFSYSQEEGMTRLDAEYVSSVVKENIGLLKADAFFLCGPAEMIETVTEKLKLFGVPETKINRELFTAKDATESADITEPVKSKVKVILDGEEVEINYKPQGKGILELLDSEGYDPPFSCRGGVCSTCKAKIMKGSATMKVNFVLTDKEIEEGQILCCQAQPTSSELTLSFDE